MCKRKYYRHRVQRSPGHLIINLAQSVYVRAMVGRYYLYLFLLLSITSQIILATDGQYNTELAGNDEEIFGVDPESGFLYALKPFDRERKASYTLQVTLRKGVEEEILSQMVTIHIMVKDENDNMPVFTENTFYGIVSKGTKQGVAFMHVNATDLDDSSTPNADLRYKLISRYPARSYENMFQVDPKTGAISLTEQGVSSLSKLEVKHFKLEVQVKDFGDEPMGYTSVANLEISVAENTWIAESPVLLQENQKGGYPRIISEVKWNSTELHYSLKGDFSGEVFRIDEDGKIYIMSELDRETQAEYQIEVSAMNDEDIPYADHLLIVIKVIDENDNTPTFPQDTYHVDVTERTTKGTLLVHLTATDADDRNTKNAQIRYKITSQEPKLPKDFLFHLEEHTGHLTLQDAKLKASIAKKYKLEISATDLGGDPEGLSSTCFVFINVIDVNDSPPVFVKNKFAPFLIPEDAQTGMLIITLTATDEDEQIENKIIDFYIQSGNEDGTFGITTNQEQSTMTIFLEKDLDYEQTQEYNLIITVRNRAELLGTEYSPTSTAAIHIMVVNVNEAPVFTQKKYEVRVPESAQAGSVILAVEASDPDIYHQAGLIYSIRNDSKRCLSIQEHSGKIQLLHSLDREVFEDTYTVQVLVQEKGDRGLSATADVVIYILDVNDNIPILVGDYSEEYFCTPRRDNQRIIIRAFDLDSVENSAPFTFTLSNEPTLQSRWRVTALNGTHAYLSMGISYLEPRVHYVLIIITDSGTPPQSQHVHLPVTVCRCSTRGFCKIEVEKMENMPTISSALGILLGTLGAIGFFLIIIFAHMSLGAPSKQTRKSDTV
uniref:Cadherin 16 n=1 Tax=Xenopus tropicalis TaxID=8364 RepID=A0A803JCV1_XENTR